MSGRELMQQPSRMIREDEVRDLLRKFLLEEEQDVYDWESIKKGTLSHNWIYDLFEDSKSRIWVGTWGGGISLLDGDQWRHFSREHGLASNAVTCIREDREGRIWAATDSGLNLFDGSRFVSAGLKGKSLLHIQFDRNGHLWAACWRSSFSGGGLFRFDGDHWEAHTVSKGLPGMEILRIFEDSNGRIWVGSYEHGNGAGVACFDGTRWQTFNQRSGLIHNCVYSMFEDPEGNMWFGTVGGISICDGSNWHRMTTMDGLVDDRVYSMLIDSRKKMWFGTEGGVSSYDGKNWRSFTKKDGLVEDLVRCILEDRKGRIWFGTYPYASGLGGISIAKRKESQKYLPEKLQQYLPGNLRMPKLLRTAKNRDDSTQEKKGTS